MISVLFEDNHLLVVEKPAGITTQPDLEEQCKRWLKKKYSKPGNVFLEAIHRIDKPASGIVLLGKTSKAVSRLKASFRNRETEKYYYALVEGTTDDEGQLEDYLVHDDYRARIAPEGKLSKLRYETVKHMKGRSLLRVTLETGRYHQIRIQMASIGHPIVGDRKYESHLQHSMDGIALHHAKLSLPHPITKEMVTFESLPPWMP